MIIDIIILFLDSAIDLISQVFYILKKKNVRDIVCREMLILIASYVMLAS